jgi:hypothetical protein
MKSTNKEKLYYGTLLEAGKRNRNGRIYPRELFKKAVDEYREKLKIIGVGYGELGHPETMDITMKNVSHIVKDIRFGYGKVPRKKKKAMKKNGTYQRDLVLVNYSLLNTPKGILAKKCIDNLVPSPRGVGSLDSDGVIQDDYKLLGIDLILKEEKS